MPDLVTAVIPSFNRAHTVARAIDSALGQVGAQVEVIVVDDGSSDGTGEILSSYGPRIRSIRQSNAGAAAARNRGIAEARGEFIAFLDSDDEWLPLKTQKQLEQFRAMPDLGIAACSAWFLEDGQTYDVHFTSKSCSLLSRLLNGPINTSGVMVKTSCLRSLDTFFRTDLEVYEDSELWWRLSARHESVMLPDFLVKSHRTTDSLSERIEPGAKVRTVDRFFEYLLSDKQVCDSLGNNLKSYLSQRHYIASCSFYTRGLYADAWRNWLAGVRENPYNRKWLKLALVISTPRTLRPRLKRTAGWVSAQRRVIGDLVRGAGQAKANE